MIIVEKQEGAKTITHELMGDLLILGNSVYINLPIYERDFAVHLDISENEYGMITMGLSRSYVAEIDIPAREYIEVSTGEFDEDDNEIMEMRPETFDLNKVKLTLWEVK